MTRAWRIVGPRLTVAALGAGRRRRGRRLGYRDARVGPVLRLDRGRRTSQSEQSFPARGTGNAASPGSGVAWEIREPLRIKNVAPIYPKLASAAKIQGTVLLEAVINPQGRVRAVRALKSVPPLDQAAIDAVRQWVYTPPLLNGVPVQVLMTVTVVFALR